MRQAFGDCVFDRDRRELTCRGSLAHGTPKLLALLELLLDAAPRAVTKSDIHKALWPNTFVSDATLTSLVADLRTAVGDDGRAPRLVRTIHGYGYAFVADVVVMRDAAGASDTRSFRIIMGDREIALARGVHLLGRSPDVAVFVDDPGVSRHHSRITIGAEGATLEDLGSKNGTILNDRRVTAAIGLTDGGVIVLGATVLKFRIFDTQSSTATVSRTSE
jgi:DNA-binding winged helix-turn-helix (wHTH) protein